MGRLEAILLPEVEAADIAGLLLHLMQAMAISGRPPVLLVHSTPGPAVSIGSYTAYQGPKGRSGVTISRRLTGGRVVGAGTGWAGVALIAPARSALPGAAASALRPEQVMNRSVRGILVGLRTLGIECFYPGRDSITVDGREIAMCSFTEDGSGTILFEASLALNRSMTDLATDLERLDPEGQLTCRMCTPDTATTLGRELGREVAFEEISSAIVAGYSKLLGEVRCTEVSSATWEEARRVSRQLETSGWLERPAGRVGYNRTGRIAGQLGSVAAHIAVRPDGMIDSLSLTGDFIANPTGLDRLERELRDRSIDLTTVSSAVGKTYSDDRNFFLGLGDPSNLVTLLMRAQ